MPDRRQIIVLLLCALPTALLPAQEDARVQQYVQMLQPSMWRELDFVRQVCGDIPLDVRPKIKTAAEAAVKEAATAMTKPQRQPVTTFAAKTVRDGVRDSLKKLLSEDLYNKYAAEDDLRIAAAKDASIAGLVSQIDGVLFLNEQQREKITADLDSHWQPEWEHWLTMYQHNAQYFPQVPEQYVAPHLTPEQKTVWNGLQKVMVSYWNNNGRRAADDDWWSGKTAPAPKVYTPKAKAAAKK